VANNAGRVSIYDLPTVSTPAATIDGDGPAAEWGNAVALEADRLAIGGIEFGMTAVVYGRNSSGVWVEGISFEPINMISSLDFGASVALSDNRIFVGDPLAAPGLDIVGGIHVAPAYTDCDANGSDDRCLPFGVALNDCNENGIWDACEIMDGVLEDCNANMIPDECEVLPVAEVIFIVDESPSLIGDVEPCELISEVSEDLRQSLASNGIALHVIAFAVATPGGFFIYECNNGSVAATFGPEIPGNLPCCPVLGADATFDNFGLQEDWGGAVAIVSEKYSWASSARVIIVLTDECASSGGAGVNTGPVGQFPDPCDGNDSASLLNAVALAEQNLVSLLPVLGIGAIPPVTTDLTSQAVASAFVLDPIQIETGDTPLSIANEIVTAILPEILAAGPFGRAQDCNENGSPDSCDIAMGVSQDINENGIPDECVFYPCPWDVVPSLDVNLDDLLGVINNFGCPNEAFQAPCIGDIAPDNGDGTYGNGEVNLDDLLAIINNFDAECDNLGLAIQSSSILRIVSVDFSSGWMDETGTVDSASATAVSTGWATFDASWDVYRVWVEVPDSTTYIDAVSGSEDNNTPALITNDSSTYYNNGYGNNYPPNPALFATSGFEALAFDTFLTIGNAGSGGGNPSVQGTIDLTGDTNSKSVGWYKTGGVAPVAGGSTGWRVLVGQFSVPDGEDFCISLHITGDGIDEYATVCSP
jgi:hypothetical protein